VTGTGAGAAPRASVSNDYPVHPRSRWIFCGDAGSNLFFEDNVPSGTAGPISIDKRSTSGISGIGSKPE